MALNYGNIFGDIGKYIKFVDELRFLALGAPLGALTATKCSGTHTGAADQPVLTDSAGGWTVNELIGMTVNNVADSSVAVITENTATTVTHALGLSGGTDNDWDNGDVYNIDFPSVDFPALETEIFTQLEASGKENLLDGVFSLFESQKDSIIALAVTWAGKVNSRLLDRETVINELDGVVSTSGIADVIEELSRQMIKDSEDIKGSSVSIQAWAANADNKGSATIANQSFLDGFSVPGSGFAASKQYSNRASNLSVPSENMTLTVTTDRDTTGVTAGHEAWLLEGQPASTSALGWRTEGSGTSLAIPILNSYSTIANRNFETFSAGIPTSWTLESGVAGTELITETVAADVYRGSSAIRLDGTSTNVEIRQAIANQAILPDRWYHLTVQVHTDGLVAGVGLLEILFISDSGDYVADPAKNELISMDQTALNLQNSATKSDWHEFFNWLTPKVIPDDLELSIKLGGATAGKVHIDSLAFGPFIYGNGFGIAISARESGEQLAIGDRYTTTVTNDEAIFQRFFRRHLKVQLPYQTDKSETQPDDLAT